MTKNVPISDRGIATTGMMTARTLPRNRKITAVDDQQRLDQGLLDLANRCGDELGAVVDDLAGQPTGSCDWMSGIAARTRCATSRMFASGATLMPMKTASLPLKDTLAL